LNLIRFTERTRIRQGARFCSDDIFDARRVNDVDFLYEAGAERRYQHPAFKVATTWKLFGAMVAAWRRVAPKEIAEGYDG
jgi:hypothetical protein